jgi:hypothetical protein
MGEDGKHERSVDPTDDEDVGNDAGDADPEAPLYSTVPLEDEHGNVHVIRQQNVGKDNELGGGEWPDPDTPAQPPAPGAD